MFRNRFWVSLALSVPVLLYSEMLQMWLGFRVPTFPGSRWLGPLFAVIVFCPTLNTMALSGMTFKCEISGW